MNIEIETSGTRTLHLRVDNAGDGSAFDHADWAEAKVLLADGQTLWLDEAPLGTVPAQKARYPFSFVYNGAGSGELLGKWPNGTSSVHSESSLIWKPRTDLAFQGSLVPPIATAARGT